MVKRKTLEITRAGIGGAEGFGELCTVMRERISVKIGGISE